MGLGLFLKAIQLSIPNFLPLVGCTRMDLLEVSAKITALSEILLAVLASEGPLSSVFSEMVSQIARLFEYTPAVWVHTLEVQFLSLSLGVFYLYGFVPITWDTLKVL
jgi:hypothetical protein